MRERERENAIFEFETTAWALFFEKSFYSRKGSLLSLDYLTSTPWAAVFACAVSTAVAAVRRNLSKGESFGGKKEFDVVVRLP